MPLITAKTEGHIITMIINRPDALNALGRSGDGDEVRAVCDEINVNQSIRCAVLTGSGKAFSAGGDVKAMKERSGAFVAHGVGIRDGYRNNIHRIVNALVNLEVPLIAAVNGPAIGLGCDIACMADIRIASEKAKFGPTFLKLGLVPGDGGAWLLPRVIGMSRACELLYTGRVIDAETAVAWGLVSQCTPHDELMPLAMQLAKDIAAQPPHALRFTKNLLRHGQTANYDTIMDMSAAVQAISHLTEDHMEGVDAILEKRSPEFFGK